MQIIRFSGKTKKENIKRAIAFYYDNFNNKMTFETFLAKCRIQNDKKTVHFYPEMTIDVNRRHKNKNTEKRI